MFSIPLPSRFLRMFILSLLLFFCLGSLLFVDKLRVNNFLDSQGKKLGYESIHLPSLGQGARPPAAPPQGYHKQEVLPDVDETTKQGVEDGLEIVPIMDALGNETAKALLGRATWKYLHTLTLRFPATPTADEREALKNYFWLTGRLYPCGDCAKHFLGLLKLYPPQTSSRKAASEWLCFVHNQVNERLGKAQYNCADMGGDYDCGCGTEGNSTESDVLAPTTASKKKPADKEPADVALAQSIHSLSKGTLSGAHSDSMAESDADPYDEKLGVTLMRGGKRSDELP